MADAQMPPFNPNWSEAVRIEWLRTYAAVHGAPAGSFLADQDGPATWCISWPQSAGERIGKMLLDQGIPTVKFNESDGIPKSVPVDDLSGKKIKPSMPHLTPTQHQAVPVDEQATIDAMRREIAPYSDQWENIATDLLAAIRRGEVPGLTTTDEKAKSEWDHYCAGLVEGRVERDAEKARADRAEAELAEAVRLLREFHDLESSLAVNAWLGRLDAFLAKHKAAP